MKISIIGAGRTRNGIGQYIAKYFQKNHTSVIAALGSTEKTAQRAVDGLRQYDIDARAYSDFDLMVQAEKPDAVVIASPVHTHYEYLIKSIDMGLNIFCEKPFFWLQKGLLPDMLDEIFKRAAHKNLTIAMNSQWPFSIPFYEKLCGPIDARRIDSFFMHLSPIFTGGEMILDSLPHALSILYFVMGSGEIRALEAEKGTQNIGLRFQYISNTHKYEVSIQLENQNQQPRSLKYGFNGKIVKRGVDPGNYDIYFYYKNKNLKITDPLELSVRDFIGSVREQREPLIGQSHIIPTTLLLKKIYDLYQME